MKLKLNFELKNDKGQPLILEKGKPAMSFKDACIESILMPVQGEEDETKWKKFLIWEKIKDAEEEVDLTVDEISLLKSSIGKHQAQLVMGQCWRIIEKQ